MMTHDPSQDTDSLLKSAQIFAVVLRAVCLLLALLAAAFAVIGGVAVSATYLGLYELPEWYDLGSLKENAMAVAVAAMVAVALALAASFLANLSAIIRSVGEGEPFRPDNAERLQAMGWLALSMTILGLVIEGVDRHGVGPGSSIGWDSGAEGFLLALVLFILARVFRHGTALRDDLEGTV